MIQKTCHHENIEGVVVGGWPLEEGLGELLFWQCVECKKFFESKEG